MTNQQIHAVIKAGYVIITALEQSRENLNLLERIITENLNEDITAEHVKKGKNMRMKDMIPTLTSFGNGKGDQNDAAHTINAIRWKVPTNSKAQLLAEEILQLIETGK